MVFAAATGARPHHHTPDRWRRPAHGRSFWDGATHATPYGLSIFELRVLGDDGEFLDITGATASFEQSGNPAASASW